MKRFYRHSFVFCLVLAIAALAVTPTMRTAHAEGVSSATIEDIERVLLDRWAKELEKVPFRGFFLIAFVGSAADMEKALQAGADPNAGDPDHGGTPPLSLAAGSNQDPGVITALIKAGANVNHVGKYYQRTPLHMAVIFNKNPVPVVQALLAAKPNIYLNDTQYMTPLEYAIAGTIQGDSFDGVPRHDIILTLLQAVPTLPVSLDKKEYDRYFAYTYEKYLSGAGKPNPEVVKAFQALGAVSK